MEAGERACGGGASKVEEKRRKVMRAGWTVWALVW